MKAMLRSHVLTKAVSGVFHNKSPHNLLTTSVTLRIIFSVILQLHAGVGIYLPGNLPGRSAGAAIKLINTSGPRNHLENNA